MSGEIDNNSQQNGSRIEPQQPPEKTSSPLSTMDKIELPTDNVENGEDQDTIENLDLVTGVINIENQDHQAKNFKFDKKDKNGSRIQKRNTITTDPDSNKEVPIPDEEMSALRSDYVAKHDEEMAAKI